MKAAEGHRGGVGGDASDGLGLLVLIASKPPNKISCTFPLVTNFERRNDQEKLQHSSAYHQMGPKLPKHGPLIF